MANKSSGKQRRIPQITKKLAFIEGMRALAALYVVISHLCSMVDPLFTSTGKSAVSPILRSVMAPFWHGHLAVAAFIVLSGFSLQYGLYQREDGRVYGLGTFYKRRALRILPAYYGSLIFSLGVCALVTIPNGSIPPLNNYLPVTSDAVLSHVFLVHNWRLDWMYKINGALWSIPIEAQLYVIFPFLVVVMKRISPLAVLGVVGVPTALTVFLARNAGKMYSWFAVLFVLGMIAAHFSYRPHLAFGHKPKSAMIIGCIGFVATALIVGSSLAAGRPFDTATLIGSDVTFGLTTATFLYVLTSHPGTRLERMLEWRPLVQLGVFSYSLYLLHHPLIQIFALYRPSFVPAGDATFWYLALFGIWPIIGISWLFSLFFERPFVKSSLPRSHVAKFEFQLPVQSVNRARATGAVKSYAYLAGPCPPDSESAAPSPPKDEEAELNAKTRLI